MKLRTSLIVLAVGSLVPLLVFAAVAVAVLVRHERDTMERETMGRVISAMSAVDAKLRGSITMLESLGTSRNLASGDLPAFHEEARRVLATQRDWINIGLATPAREQLMDAILPVDAPASFGDDSAFDLAVTTARPAVGDLNEGPAVGEPVVRVRVPVTIEGKVRYILSAPIRQAAFTDLLRAQEVDRSWVIGLTDRNKRFVSRIPEVAPGTPASQDLRGQLTRSPQGWFRGKTLEGIETYTPYVTSSLSGWALHMAIPASTVEAGMWRSFAVAGGGAVGALLFALAFAWALGRRIEAPFAALARDAAAMGRGEEARTTYSGRIREVAQLRKALHEASVAVRLRAEFAGREKAALEREQRALKASDAAKDQFIAMLSHELRNPLGALTAATHLLKQTKIGDPDAVQACDVAERQTRQMARLVEDLLDVSRIVSGKANLQPELFDLGEATRELLDAWKAAGRFAAHHVAVDTTSLTVRADRARMDQILANLLDNALKFTPAGGTIRISVRQDGEAAILAVEDDGDGIEPDALASVFDVFSQGDQGLARRKGGLGLGLAIVKRVAELQGATVEAKSAGVGKGSSFFVRLPVAAPRQAPVEAARQRTGTPSDGPRHILVIDDNDDMRQMLRLTLATEGREVREARDGASGLAHAAATKPDVVLVDVGLPDMDGYEVARRLRAHPGGANLRLIALTGYGQEDDRRRAAEAGFDAHLTKPVTPEVLERAITEATRTGN